MPWPDAMLVEIPTVAAEELLALLDGCPMSPALRTLMANLRGEVSVARAQTPLFPGAK